ncbi:MAG TPA: 5-methyltetrahydropteroyltriglutamate--homocysteine S-methyltransferase [Stellaceae bacterium]|nr:5-methyltetrahydropteroyltriglutamate--homocysteine S-methyltransferase [Stellaceae bacterium]
MANASHLHVDHVGSLLRPAALREARIRLLGKHDADHNLGPHRNAELTAIEDGFVRDAVKLQEDSGLSVVTDGDYRRRSWWTDFLLGFSGLRISYDGKTPITLINAAGETRPIAGFKIEGAIRPRESTLAKSFEFLKSATSRTAKATIPGPPIVHFLRDADFIPAVYKDIDTFWADLVAAYRVEIAKLAATGCKFLQIDECMLPYLCDPRHRKMSASRGDDPDTLIQTYVRVIDEIASEKPKDMIVAMHMCRGNMNAFWGGDGGYGPVAEAVFNMSNIDAFLLEYDTPRAGDFTPLRHVPRGKQVLLGIVSTKDAHIEDKDALKHRVDEAARHLNGAQLGICPQCGFSTNLFGTDFTIDVERRKLELLVETAAEIWGG